MKSPSEPRRPSLATIVGSSLAIAAAGSLLAFSSLAEQAGLQGLAAVGIQPAQPGTVGEGGGKAITIPAPSTAPPSDPRAELEELVRETLERDQELAAAAPRPTISFARAPQRTRPERPEPVPVARVAVAGPPVDDDEPQWDGPPYGHAYGHYKDKDDVKPKPAKKKHAPKSRGNDQPVYARSTAEEPRAAPKAPKMKKVNKAEAKGHAKHAHGKGKGKGHTKHGG